MPYEYCCFISYPHGQDNVLVPFVKELVKSLETEIYAQIRKKVWIDYHYLKGGSRLDHEIGPDICKSACMILLYTPLYFDSEHTYCARELKAMQDLEEQRLSHLADKGKGLIIPVILRGPSRFPATLREKRLYYDFNSIQFSDPKSKIRGKVAKEIREIAEYIIDRCLQLDAVADKMPHDCDNFLLPTHEEAKRFVQTVLGQDISDVAVPFVIRTEEPPTVQR
jgi:hypothetical protein